MLGWMYIIQKVLRPHWGLLQYGKWMKFDTLLLGLVSSFCVKVVILMGVWSLFTNWIKWNWTCNFHYYGKIVVESNLEKWKFTFCIMLEKIHAMECSCHWFGFWFLVFGFWSCGFCVWLQLEFKAKAKGKKKPKFGRVILVSIKWLLRGVDFVLKFIGMKLILY